MTRTFKVLAALLSYPTQDIVDAAPAFKDVLADEGLMSRRDQLRVGRLVDQLMSRDLYDLQERYVQLFDRSRTLSLHLFEHVHGESRDRGQAMVDLLTLYQQNGLEMAAGELPDFLPLFLEFLSTQPIAEARALLGETAHVLDALTERLRKRKSIYAAVFRGIANLANRSTDAKTAVETPANEDESLEALDRAWAEEQVTFGPDPEAGCPVADDMLSRMTDPSDSNLNKGGQP